MNHLLPSSSFLGAFLVRMLSGLGFLPGMGDLPREEESDAVDDERTGPEGTPAFWARSEGFLWVCDEGSTFLRWDVTDAPREISLKTAPISAVLPLGAVPLDGNGGGGGALSNVGSGGGGGGAGAGAVLDDGGGVFDDD